LSTVPFACTEYPLDAIRYRKFHDTGAC